MTKEQNETVVTITNPEVFDNAVGNPFWSATLVDNGDGTCSLKETTPYVTFGPPMSKEEEAKFKFPATLYGYPVIQE